MRDALHPELDRARDVIAAHRFYGIGNRRTVSRAATYLAMNGDRGDMHAASDAMRELGEEADRGPLNLVCWLIFFAAAVALLTIAAIVTVNANNAPPCRTVEACVSNAEAGQ